VQLHGGIRLGDALLRIQDTDTAALRFNEVEGALAEPARHGLRVLTFASPEKYASLLALRASGRGFGLEDPLTTRNSIGGGIGGDFVSTVRQSRITQVASKGGSRGGSRPFAEYEVFCRLRVPHSDKVQSASVLEWSVWHRFSHFEALHNELALGHWQMEKLKLPPKHSLLALTNSLAPALLKRRCEALDDYWRQVCGVDRVADFGQHHADPALEAFLDVARVMESTSSPPPPSLSGGARASSLPHGGAPSPSETKSSPFSLQPMTNRQQKKPTIKRRRCSAKESAGQSESCNC